MKENGQKAKRPTKYYSAEFDIAVTTEGARRWYDTTTMNEMYPTFEAFVNAELLDLSDERQHSDAQMLHERWGWVSPVCSWKTLIANAKKHFAS